MSRQVDDYRVASKEPGRDRRCKLTLEQKAAIREEYPKGMTSHNKLAKKYGVSKRLIQFILKPDKLEENRKLRTPDRVVHYNRDHTPAMRRHRAWKRELIEKEN